MFKKPAASPKTAGFSFPEEYERFRSDLEERAKLCDGTLEPLILRSTPCLIIIALQLRKRTVTVPPPPLGSPAEERSRAAGGLVLCAHLSLGAPTPNPVRKKRAPEARYAYGAREGDRF
jgi:hypothetical protein